MGYNDIEASVYTRQIAETGRVPYQFVRMAQYYQDKLDLFTPDMKTLLQYILDSFLVEAEETVSKTGADAVATGGGAAATAASHVGTEDLSSGFDWGTTNQDFGIDGTTVTLDTETTDVATTVTEINDALAAATVNNVEAFADGDNVGIRTTTTGSAASFTINSGTALSTLGWNAATYTGTDEVADTWAEFQPNFGNVGVKESSFIAKVEGSIVSHSVQGYDPLVIRINDVPEAGESVTFDAANPFTSTEMITERDFSIQPYFQYWDRFV